MKTRTLIITCVIASLFFLYFVGQYVVVFSSHIRPGDYVSVEIRPTDVEGNQRNVTLKKESMSASMTVRDGGYVDVMVVTAGIPVTAKSGRISNGELVFEREVSDSGVVVKNDACKIRKIGGRVIIEDANNSLFPTMDFARKYWGLEENDDHLTFIFVKDK